MRQKKDFFNRVWLYRMGVLLMSLLCVSVSSGQFATQLESVIGENNVYFFSYNTFGQVSNGQWPEYDQLWGAISGTVGMSYESNFEQGDYEFPPRQDSWQYGTTPFPLSALYSSTDVGDWRPITQMSYQDEYAGQLSCDIQYVSVPSFWEGTEAYPLLLSVTADGRYGETFITSTVEVLHELMPYEYGYSFTYLTGWEARIDDGVGLYSETSTIEYETGYSPQPNPPRYITEWWKEKSSVGGGPFLYARIFRVSYPYAGPEETSPVVAVQFPQVYPSSVLTTTYEVAGEFAPFLYNAVHTYGPDGNPLRWELYRDDPSHKAITRIDLRDPNVLTARYFFTYDEQKVVQLVEHFTEGDEWITYTYEYKPTQYLWEEISAVYVDRGDGPTTFALVNFADEVTTSVAGNSKLDTFIYDSGGIIPRAVVSNYGHYRQYLREPLSPPWGYLYLPAYNPLLTVYGYDSEGKLMALFTAKLYMGAWTGSQFDGLRLCQYLEGNPGKRLLAMMVTDPFWNAGSVFLFFHNYLGQLDAIWDLMGEGLVYRHFGYYEDGGQLVPLVQRNARAKAYSPQDILPLGLYELIPTPDIDSEPGALDFGQLLIGSTMDLDYELWNRGDAPLEVTSLEIMGEDAGQFSFVSPPTLPLTIAPETCQTIDVRFQPTRICYKDAYVETRSNDPDEDPFTLPALQAKARSERLELCGVDINDTRLLSIAGDYEFIFSSQPELELSGAFTQDARGKLGFAGTIREADQATSITTKGKLKVKKKTNEVYAKLKPVKAAALGAKVKLELMIPNDTIELTIKYKKKGMATIVATASAPLGCSERGARIVIPEMNEIKPNKKYEGDGTLILPCGLEVPLTVKEKAKQKKDGSEKRNYRIKGEAKSATLRLKVFMPSIAAEEMELIKARGKISYVRRIDPATVELVY